MAQPGDRWRQPGIGDYSFLSDCASAALVDRDASIDWWCVPRFDSPSVFGRLLDPEAGHWTLHPTGDFESTRRYVEDTLVLCTRFVTPTGTVTVTDTLAFEYGARGHEIGLRSPHILLRNVEGLHGSVQMHSEFAPRMEYGRTRPHLRVTESGVEARGGPVRLMCSGPVTWECVDSRAVTTFDVSAGHRTELRVGYVASFEPPAARDRPSEDAPQATVDDTIAAWQSWAAEHTSYDGAFPAEVRRSSLVLQGLTFQPSGAVVAAATTSLPEVMGGEFNFDYRFAWLRDLSLTIRSLWLAACPHEPDRLFRWFANAAGHLGDELVQIMYGVEGERDLTERELGNLAGYRGNRPVRVGNNAWEQKQLDVLGEVLDAAYILRDSLGDLDHPVQHLLVTFADRAAKDWPQPDSGMWETRDAVRHYTSSKVMCWVALDRAVTLASRISATSDAVARWAAARDDVHAAVVDQAWSESLGAYAGAFGSDDLDASVLILPLVGFLPASNARMRATIEVIDTQLGSGGLVRRWSAEPHGFLICTYWLVECLALGGQSERAEEIFRLATSYANDLGLLSEQADQTSRELLGNMPQAFSHVGLINAAWRLAHSSTDFADTPGGPA
ncbi:glycoside hydrolase family 15 protein [Jatrophihabitans lederbergiae]|uniref:Glycoside hydrolase family 15 protein n=1 Tax=Jatrophihabitans lederbergiae TaxID=3075547 RepID=A0ABU2JGH4_9ACTN|nr:glycoside hydrolase family 15 protein [Jatrophihabitans sp. DSM 44399]MDT0264090.1 glycoside hydrolase family 15 protein [Jatrophihabitans sp. DSM 44399]